MAVKHIFHEPINNPSILLERERERERESTIDGERIVSENLGSWSL